MKRRRWFKILAGFGVLLLVAASLAWFFPQQILTVDSGAVKADVLVVLGGGGGDRAQRATELFKAGEAPDILVSGSGDCESNEQFLEKGGVPERAISLERGSHTTLENAKFSVPLLRQMGARRVIIVTSWYHSRRALRCFEHFAPDIQFYSRPSCFGYPREQWRPKGINGYVKAEYMKLLGYWARYGVCPF